MTFDNTNLLDPSLEGQFKIRFNMYTNQFSFYRVEDTVPQGTEWLIVSLPHYEFLIRQTRLGKILKVHRGDVIAVAPDPVKVTMYALRNCVIKALESISENRARELGYETAAELVSYADEPSDLQFQVEGKAFRRWRAQSRRAALEFAETLYQDGACVLPRTFQVEAVLPKFELMPPTE